MGDPKILRKIVSRFSMVTPLRRSSSAAFFTSSFRTLLSDKVRPIGPPPKRDYMHTTPNIKNFKYYLRTPTRSSIETLFCSPLSLSRTVTVLFSNVSKSIVTQYGVPISSCLLYRLPMLPLSSKTA